MVKGVLSSVDALLSLANTAHGPQAHEPPSREPDSVTHDHLSGPAAVQDFLHEEGVETPTASPDSRDLASLRRLRDAVWSLTKPGGLKASRRLAAPLLARATYRMALDGALAPASTGWWGFVTGLLPSLLELQHMPQRLKVCKNPGCRWLFVDRTKNQSRVWCDMSACGNRAKVGRFMRRRSSETRRRTAPSPRRGPTRSPRRPASGAAPPG